MNVLNPKLLWVGNRCYRLTEFDSQLDNTENSDNGPVDETIEVCSDNVNDEEEMKLNSIIATGNGKFKKSFHVSRAYFPFLIGTKGTTRKQIESKTGTHVYIPRQFEESQVEITGPNVRSVVLATRHIEGTIQTARNKLPFTHFISIPMVSMQIKDNFNKFKDEVLSIYGNARGLDGSIFQTADKLHLTLVTLLLTDDNERQLAKTTLEKLEEDLRTLMSQRKPLTVEVKGIEYMNDDPCEVDVLYGQVHVKESPGLLQDIADKVVHAFGETDFVKKEDPKQVKLHVTLINTIFRREKSENIEERQPFNRNKTRETFDASKILKDFGDYFFGELIVDSIHISQRYTTAPDGFYRATAKASF